MSATRMAPKNNGKVTDEELGRVADHVNINYVEKLSVQFLALTKNEVDNCRHDAMRNGGENYGWMTIFYCLCRWRYNAKDSNTRELLHECLCRASRDGLITKTDVAFLKDTPATALAEQYDRKLHLESRRGKLVKQQPVMVEDDDGEIVRKELPAAIHVATASSPTMTSYNVIVKTSDVKYAGTDANVYVKLIGPGGLESDDILLVDKTKNLFEKNQIDEFPLPDMPSVGDIKQLKVWHDDKGTLSDWHPEYIRVLDRSSGKWYNFPCGNWLKKGPGHTLQRTLKRDSSVDYGELKEYDFTVVTSTLKNAGMKHNVFIAFDESLKKAIILKSEAAETPFGQGKTATFKIPHRDLGRLNAIWIGAFVQGGETKTCRDEKWSCQKIVIENTDSQASEEKYSFTCGRWVAVSDHITRDYAVKLHLNKIKYKVTVVTGDVFGAGTDANVFITLFGGNGESGKQQLTKKRVNLFEQKKIDTFELEMEDLGDLSQLTIEHDATMPGADWHLDHVKVADLSRDREWYFPCQKWLKKSDKTNKRTLKPK